MQANRHNLSEILEKTVRLVAPLFQRPYVWNQERNWEPLWQAIQDAAERRMASPSVRPHFLGAVVLNQLWTPMGRVSSREIIDGQQRLTTLQIAMAAARDQLADGGYEFFSQKLASMTQNHTRNDDEERYKVWPTNRDRTEFVSAMKHGAQLVNTTPPGHSKLLDAYRYFHESVGEWLGHEGDVHREIRAEALTTVFTQDLILVVIDLDQDDDGQLIFETLNALGTPLLPSDLVKNLLFHESEKAGLESERLYTQYWSEFDQNDRYWREELRVGRLKRPRLDVFLQHYLTLKLGKFVMVEGSFRAYRDLLLEGRFASIEAAFADFRHYADLYQSLDNPEPGSVEAQFFGRFWYLDTQAVVPVLLELFHRHSSSDARRPFLVDIESYFFRRMICQLTTQAMNLIVIDLLGHLNQLGWTHAAMQNYFATREGDRTRWPDDEELRKCVVERPIYQRILWWRLVFLLKIYEESLHGGKTDPISYHGDVTIEHAMPRSWQANWPLPEGAAVDSASYRSWYVDAIGNLTLVTAKLNSALSNSAWPTKRGELAKHALLMMNHELTEHETWAEEDIKARGERMFEVFRTTWPRP